MDADQAILRNKVLAGMPASDFARLRRNLEMVALPLRKQLEVRHRRTEFVYFPESGIASMVVTGGSQHTVEVGMIGRESMTGHAVVMASERSAHEIFMQGPGTGWRIGAAELTAAIEESAALRHLLLRHVYVFQIQMSFTALANARYKIDERLARWLLMCQDRTGDADLPLTHEFLSIMLGVRRPGVTSTLNRFEERRLIRARRGFITILNRPALEDSANGSYGAPEAEYERLFG